MTPKNKDEESCRKHTRSFTFDVLPVTPSTCTTMTQTTDSSIHSSSKFDHVGLSLFSPLDSSSEDNNEMLFQTVDETFLRNLHQSFSTKRANSHDYSCAEDSILIKTSDQDSIKEMGYDEQKEQCSICNNGLMNFGKVFGTLILRVKTPETVIEMGDYNEPFDQYGFLNDETSSVRYYESEELSSPAPPLFPELTRSYEFKNSNRSPVPKIPRRNDDYIVEATAGDILSPSSPHASHLLFHEDEYRIESSSHEGILGLQSPDYHSSHYSSRNEELSVSPPSQHFISDNAYPLQPHPLILSPNDNRSEMNSISINDNYYETVQTNSIATPTHYAMNSNCTTLSSQSPQHHLICSVASIKVEIETEWLEQASACARKGDNIRALYYYGKVLNKNCQESITIDDLDDHDDDENNCKITSIWHNIGILQWKTGAYDMSLESLEQALSKARCLFSRCRQDEVVLDRQKEQLSEILNSLGRVHVSQGAYDKAMSCHEESFSILESMFSLNNNHGDYDKFIDIDDSKSLIEEVEFMQQLGTSCNERACNDKLETIPIPTLSILHPGIARTMICIGSVHHLKGNHSLAMARFRDGLYIQRKTVGPDHVDVGATLNSIGSVYEKIGDYVKAMKCFKKARKIYVDQLGNMHVDVAVTLNNIGQIYHYLKKYDKSMEAYEEALGIMRQLLGLGHRNVAATMYNIGLVHISREEYSNALKILKDTLTSQRLALGDNHIDVALTQQAIADAYENIGKVDRSLKLFQKILKIRRNALGKENIVVALTLDRIGQIHLKYDKDMKEAVRRFEEALRQYRKCGIDDDDSLIILIIRNLKDATERLEHRRSL